MALVRAKNKKSGITYVYESESYWDKEKKQPRNKRKLIGKVNEATGEIVPTRKRTQNGAGPCSMCRAYEKRIADIETAMRTQSSEIAGLKAERKALARKLMELAKSCD